MLGIFYRFGAFSTLWFAKAQWLLAAAINSVHPAVSFSPKPERFGHPDPSLEFSFLLSTVEAKLIFWLLKQLSHVSTAFGPAKVCSPFMVLVGSLRGSKTPRAQCKKTTVLLNCSRPLASYR